MRLGLGLGLTSRIALSARAGSDPLSTVVSSACCDLDATLSDSYGGSGQTWANLIASPADSSNQTDWDYWRGADNTVDETGNGSTDPLFSGTAGDAAAFWDFPNDGGGINGEEYFTSKLTGTNLPAALKNAHKSGNEFWVCIACNFKSGHDIHFWSTADQSGTGGAVNGVALRDGELRVYTNTDNQISFRVPSITMEQGNKQGTAYDRDAVIIVTGDLNASDFNAKVVDRGTNTIIKETALGYDNSPSSTDKADPSYIAQDNATGDRPAADSKLYHFSWGNSYLTDSEIDDIIHHLELRHNRDYDGDGVKGATKRSAISTSETTLQDDLASACFDLDATISDSYDGSAKYWRNIIDSPASGDDPHLFDFTLGVDNTDLIPTFTGSAGDSAAYFDMGSALFSLTHRTIPDFINSIHKDGTAFWLAFCIYDADGSGNFEPWYNISGNVLSTANEGSLIRIQTTGNVQLFQVAGGNFTNQANSHSYPGAATPMLCIVSHDGTSSLRTWLNNRTGVNGSLTYTATTKDLFESVLIGGSTNASIGVRAEFETNDRLYSISGGNAFLDDTDAAKIFDRYNARHSRTYA